MKAIVLNGATTDNDALEVAHRIFVDDLTARAWQVAPFILRRTEIGYCHGDFGCWVRTPGVCVFKDAAADAAMTFIRSDLAILLTPITFGGYSSELKKALDRMICLISPFFMKLKGEIHHVKRYEQYPRIVAVGTLPEPDAEAEAIFRELVRRNAANMHAPASAVTVILNHEPAEPIRAKLRGALEAAGVQV